MAFRQVLDDRDQAYRDRRDSANQWRKQRGFDLWEPLPADEYLDHLKSMVLLTLNTGMRRGELFNLRWLDIDLDHQILTVSGSYSKSGRTRQIPLNEEAIEIFRAVANANRAGIRICFHRQVWWQSEQCQEGMAEATAERGD
jgi:integrase